MRYCPNCKFFKEIKNPIIGLNYYLACLNEERGKYTPTFEFGSCCLYQSREESK